MYTVKDIKAYVVKKGLDIRSKKREIAEERFFLIAVLRYRFKLSLQDIASIFKNEGPSGHSSIHYGLKKCTDLYLIGNDAVFLQNTRSVRKLFPFEPVDYISEIVESSQTTEVTFEMSVTNKAKLKKLQKQFGADTVEETLNILIRRY